jgi:hypothetical protein
MNTADLTIDSLRALTRAIDTYLFSQHKVIENLRKMDVIPWHLVEATLDEIDRIKGVRSQINVYLPGKLTANDAS